MSLQGCLNSLKDNKKQTNYLQVSFTSPAAGAESASTDVGGGGGFAKPGLSWGEREGSQEDRETLNGIVMTHLQEPQNQGRYI